MGALFETMPVLTSLVFARSIRSASRPNVVESVSGPSFLAGRRRTGGKRLGLLYPENLLQSLLESERGEEGEPVVSAEESVQQVRVVCRASKLSSALLSRTRSS